MFFNFNPITAQEAAQKNVQVLAFVGDGVHSLYVRMQVLAASNKNSGGLHKMAVKFVSAAGQKISTEKVFAHYDEIEKAIFMRARNYKTASKSKNAKVADYKVATGFEAVLGYLFISGNFLRLNEILKISYEQLL